MPLDASPERFRYEGARGRHQGDWVSVGEERSFIEQCVLLGSLYNISILAFWAYAWYLGCPEIGYAATSGLLFGALGFYLGYRHRRWVDCSRSLTFGVWVVITLASWMTGQMASPILWMLPLAPMVAGHMLSKRAWAFCTFLCCGSLLGFYVASFYGDPTSVLLKEDFHLIGFRGLALVVYLFFSLFSSVSAQHELRMLENKQEDLQRARAASESAAVAKSRFLANMSHEIRTPMHGIVGTTAILQRMELDPQEREAASTIYNCGEALLALLTNVLDYSKLEAKKLVISSQAFAPAAMFQRLSSQWRPRMQRRGIELSTKLECADELRLHGDGETLAKVLSYLMDNAVRYGMGAPVQFSIHAQPAPGEGQCELVLAVQDRGPGIPLQELERVKSPFERGRGLDGDNIEGIGLGLALARSLCELMGGELVLEPGETRGLKAQVVLGLKVVESHELSAPARIVDDGEESGLRVLVVDDQLINLTIARAELQALGCRVETATGGRDAIRKCQANPYDLVLMDLQMPDLPGWKAAQLISSQPGPNQRTPVVALSAHEAGEAEALRKKGGMAGHLSKPFGQAQLEDLLQAQCGFRQAA